MPAQWTPHPRLQANARPLIQKAIDAMPPEHTYDTPDGAWTRLQNYAFS